jgi:ribonuclease HI
MTDHAALRQAAFKSELADSRRLAERSGMSETEALRATLTLRAGAAGLEQLLLARAADRLRNEQALASRRAQAAQALARRQAGPAATSGWRAWFDGSARPNPGRCTLGAVLEGPGGVQLELSRAAGYGNSSEAEYQALLAVLEAAVDIGAVGLAIHGDSQVVIDDVHAPDFASSPALQVYRAQALALLARLPGATLRWIPRHKNGRADALSQRAATHQSTEGSHARTEESPEH